MKTLVFIPSYNCEKQITRVLKQFNSEVLNYIDEIILVNNRSTDKTEKNAIDYARSHKELPIKILRNNDNYGLGGSHKVAFKYALKNKFDYIIVLHGDDQGNIKDILKVLKSEKYKEYDCCLGARFHKQSRIEGYSTFRTFGNKVYNSLFSLVVRYKVKDLGSGLNMYSTRMLKNKFYMRFPNDLTFNYCMILASNYYKHRVCFFPISWREEDQISNVKMINQAFKVLGMLGKYILYKGKFIKSNINNDKNHHDYTYKIVYEREDVYDK
ncbi:MAG: glycosyltransferase family 2 protein [Vallitalea sp.]|jgi:glycosyltransferase involved in cell wall biosynthesis|nr:glycosyltransferase family 2 protein [Vallitalea sp.]